MTSPGSVPEGKPPAHHTIVLIDFENLQPANLTPLRGGAYTIKLFYGSKQTKNALSLTEELVNHKYNAQLIQIQGAGPNALDFHIAYYIGRLAAENPGASFHIISGDKGFDPLIKHLKDHGVTCHRLASTEHFPRRGSPPAPKACNRARELADQLLILGQQGPRTRTRLVAFIKAQLQHPPADDFVAEIERALEEAGWVIPAVGRITRKPAPPHLLAQ